MLKQDRLARAAVLLAVGGGLSCLPWACGLDVLGTGPALDFDSGTCDDAGLTCD